PVVLGLRCTLILGRSCGLIPVLCPSLTFLLSTGGFRGTTSCGAIPILRPGTTFVLSALWSTGAGLIMALSALRIKGALVPGFAVALTSRVLARTALEALSLFNLDTGSNVATHKPTF